MNEIVNNLKEQLNKNPIIRIKIKVQANAKQNSLEMFDEEIIKIRINKPAVDGKANKAIIDYLSDILDVPKNNIIIIKGEKNSIKDLQITSKSHII